MRDALVSTLTHAWSVLCAHLSLSLSLSLYHSHCVEDLPPAAVLVLVLIREPLSRLSFSAYLLHPIVMTVIYGGMATPQRYSVMAMVLYVVGMWGITHICSLLLFVFVEKPFMNMEVLIFKRLGFMSTNGGGGTHSTNNNGSNNNNNGSSNNKD